MTLTCRAAVLHQSGTPLSIERVTLAPPSPTDVVVKVRAAGLCHTDLEVIDGSLRYPLPMILGHEAAGVVEQVGSAVRDVRIGDHVILSWNPHCGHCFQCDRAQPILCETYLARGLEGVHFDGTSKAQLAGGGGLAHLMFLGAFSEYVVLPAQQAIVVPKEIPFDRACLIGCGVMTGVGAALNVAEICHEQRAQFSEIAAGMRRAAEKSDDLLFMRLDHQFNTLISAASRNEFASRAMGLMHGLSRRFWYQHYKEAADLPLAARLHADVAEAIAERRVDAAGAASDSLIDYIESFARSTL